MDEAFAYSLIHDASIDVPVCTSDVFLRWAEPAADEELFRTPFSTARAWATPAQGAALDELSRSLKLTGEARLGDAYSKIPAGSRRGGRHSAVATANRRFDQVREEVRQLLLERWPELRQREGHSYAGARNQAVAELNRRARDGRLRELLSAEDALNQAEDQEYQEELAGARVLRFCRLAKSVILAHRLRESGDPALRERFEHLVAAEAGTLLPPAAAVASR
jgi:hypothetical protein